jgi:hypothetical protein
MAKLKIKGLENTSQKLCKPDNSFISEYGTNLMSFNTKGEVYINPELKIKK